MEFITILDVETTGLDTQTDKLIEIAAIFYHVPTRSIISKLSFLLPGINSNPVYEINKISEQTLKSVPFELEWSCAQLLLPVLSSSTALVAHNAEFDKKWLETYGSDGIKEVINQRRWICTKKDVKWPLHKSVPLNLISIAANLGVPITSVHRAMSDCDILLKAIETQPDIESFLNLSGKGRKLYHAVIGYENRKIAKDAGFQWDNVKKVWFAYLAEDEISQLLFPVYLAEKQLDLA